MTGRHARRCSDRLPVSRLQGETPARADCRNPRSRTLLCRNGTPAAALALRRTMRSWLSRCNAGSWAFLFANLAHRRVVDPSVDGTVGPEDPCSLSGVYEQRRTPRRIHAPLSCGETSRLRDRPDAGLSLRQEEQRQLRAAQPGGSRSPVPAAGATTATTCPLHHGLTLAACGKGIARRRLTRLSGARRSAARRRLAQAGRPGLGRGLRRSWLRSRLGAWRRRAARRWR